MAHKNLASANIPATGNTYFVAPPIMESVASTALASFSDGAENCPVEDLVVKINSLQNLNGQSAPYPAGGGDNKFNIANCVAYAAAFGLSHAIDGEYVRFYGTCSSGGTHGWRFVYVGSAMQTIGSTLSYKAFIVSGTPSITINSITYNSDNTLSINVSGLVTNQAYDFKIGVVGYTGTAPAAWTPYSNICPITGWTGMNVYRTGKNLINDSIRYEGEGRYYIGSQGAYTIPLAAGTYTFSVDFLNGSHYGAFYREENGSSNVTIWTTSGTTASATITLPAGNYRFWLYKSDITETDIGNVQLELGSTATTYEPYAGTTYPISWSDEAGTVYGGTLDVTTGVLTVTHGSDVYNGTTSPVVSVGVSSVTGNYYAIVNLTSITRATNSSNVGGAISNMLTEGVTPTAQGKFSIIGSGTQAGQASLVLPDQTITTKSAFDTYLQSNPITLVYPLTTPQTYQLTPTEVKTLLGTNNIWADTGNVAVDYFADTKLYINKVLNA